MAKRSKKTKANGTKTTKQGAKAPKAPKAKRQRSWSLMVTKDQLTASALKLINKASDIEDKIAELTAELQDVLSQIPDEVGNPSFEHPERGPMCVMCRGDKWFWRAKPEGAARRS